MANKINVNTTYLPKIVAMTSDQSSMVTMAFQAITNGRSNNNTANCQIAIIIITDRQITRDTAEGVASSNRNIQSIYENPAKLFVTSLTDDLTGYYDDMAIQLTCNQSGIWNKVMYCVYVSVVCMSVCMSVVCISVVCMSVCMSSVYICSVYVCSVYICSVYVCSVYVCYSSVYVCSVYVCSVYVCSVYVRSVYVCSVYVCRVYVCSVYVCLCVVMCLFQQVRTVNINCSHED